MDEAFVQVWMGCDLYPGHLRVHHAPLRLTRWVDLRVRLHSVPSWAWGSCHHHPLLSAGCWWGSWGPRSCLLPWNMSLGPTLYPDYTDILLYPLHNFIYSSVYCWHFPLSGQTHGLTRKFREVTSQELSEVPGQELELTCCISLSMSTCYVPDAGDNACMRVCTHTRTWCKGRCMQRDSLCSCGRKSNLSPLSSPQSSVP